MAFKVRNKKKIILPNTRYAEQVRMDIEIDQGYPLTATQDLEYRKMLGKGTITVQDAVDRLIDLRPGSAWTNSIEGRKS